MGLTLEEIAKAIVNDGSALVSAVAAEPGLTEASPEPESPTVVEEPESPTAPAEPTLPESETETAPATDGGTASADQAETAPGSVGVPVKAASVDSIGSPVKPNTTSLEDRIRDIVVEEIRNVLSTPEAQKNILSIETKLGQWLVGLAATAAITTGFAGGAAIDGGSQHTSLLVLGAGLLVTVGTAAFNKALGAFEQK